MSGARLGSAKSSVKDSCEHASPRMGGDKFVTRQGVEAIAARAASPPSAFAEPAVDSTADMALDRHRDDEASVRFIDVLRSRVFLALYVAETQSIIGDQLARVALSVLVFQRTHSTSQTALTYALTFLPAIAGGALLSGLGDRFAERTVLVCCDVARAALLLAMAVSGLPIGVLFALLTVVVFVGPAFTSAEVSLVATVLDSEHYRVATGLRMITNQVAQVAGFAVGGVIVSLVSPQWALRLDACSFALSALVIAYGTRTASGRVSPGLQRPGTPKLGIGVVLRVIRADRRLRANVGLAWLAGFFIVPEGLAAPYAAAIGGNTASVGVLLTAIPAGSVVGAYIVLRRVRPVLRTRVVGIMAVLTGLPLVACAANPNLPASVALWCLSGVFAAYLLDVVTSVVQLTPPDRRSRMVGLVGAGLVGVQGIGLIVFGIAAAHIGVAPAIATAGGIGAVLAVPLAVALLRNSHVSPLNPGGTEVYESACGS
jgi:predicted MFS family arabinose efflux permease